MALQLCQCIHLVALAHFYMPEALGSVQYACYAFGIVLIPCLLVLLCGTMRSTNDTAVTFASGGDVTVETPEGVTGA